MIIDIQEKNPVSPHLIYSSQVPCNIETPTSCIFSTKAMVIQFRSKRIHNKDLQPFIKFFLKLSGQFAVLLPKIPMIIDLHGLFILRIQAFNHFLCRIERTNNISIGF